MREIPAPNIACCGLKVSAKAQDWEDLVPGDLPSAEHLRQGLRRLHETFAQAPLLGSLLDPSKANKGDLFAADYRVLTNLLGKALATEHTSSRVDEVDNRWEVALSAQGLLEAARLLEARYHIVITNVPYLGRGHQNKLLKDFCEEHYPAAKNDLANVFLDRCLELASPGDAGVVQIVMPQNWLFLSGYKRQRESLLKRVKWNLLARLGEGGFDSNQAAGAFVILLTQTCTPPDAETLLCGIDASAPRIPSEKAKLLCDGNLLPVKQTNQLLNADFIIKFEEIKAGKLLRDYATSIQGFGTSDNAPFVHFFWEHTEIANGWEPIISAVDTTTEYAGRESVLLWEAGQGRYYRHAMALKLEGRLGGWKSGFEAWGKVGISISEMRSMPCTIYTGQKYNNTAHAVIPNSESDVPAIWCFLSSGGLTAELRKQHQGLKVSNHALLNVGFDLTHWQQIAKERYPNGIPKPYSDNPTQWIFHGHPKQSTDPLQVAVARLVGYTWPAESDEKMELSSESYEWIARSKTLASHADKDGIICIPPVGRESSANDRLLNLLAAAYGDAWSNDTLGQLLATVDHAGKSLETWLRDKFFTQHCSLFGNRPFLWHVWDGLRDGFAALVNYHKLDYKTLEALIYTYLGDWISRQKRDANSGVDGAEEKLAAAEILKKRLELILEGEAPYDIFVRWKPLTEQAIGWHPDLNDGVRMNIRPFLSVPDVDKRSAGVLRDKPNIKWDKDRGKDVESAPWYELGLQYDGKVGDRINDHHLKLEQKKVARSKT